MQEHRPAAGCESSLCCAAAKDGIHPDLGLFDLMRQREDSESPGLRRFSDKARNGVIGSLLASPAFLTGALQKMDAARGDARLHH